MKVGILTFHNAINLGAILQTYATYELVKSMGHEVEVIDYHNGNVDATYDKYRFRLSRMPRNPIYATAYLLCIMFFRKKEHKFNHFTKEFMTLSRNRYSSKSLKLEGYDVILIGSDQLWNKKITGGIDPVYWGDFDSEASIKKVSWSVSMNDYDYSSTQLEKIRHYLKNFERLSVRENLSQLFLSSYVEKPISVTLDPTLLLSTLIWKKLCRSIKKSKYVLVYAVKDFDETYTCAEKIAKEKGLTILVIKAYCGASISRNVKQTSGPIEFLSYINSADYVVTSSFHGTVFSILFEKEFTCVIPEGHSNVRTESLLNSLGLINRIGNQSSAPIQSVIDYESVNRKLEQLKEESLLFLSDALKEE